MVRNATSYRGSFVGEIINAVTRTMYTDTADTFVIGSEKSDNITNINNNITPGSIIDRDTDNADLQYRSMDNASVGYHHLGSGKTFYQSLEVLRVSLSENMTSNASFFEEFTESPIPVFNLTAMDYTIAITAALIILATIFGNILVIIAVCTEPKLRKVGNSFIVSLAVSDLLVGLVVTPLAIVAQIMKRWNLGVILCDLWVSMDVICCTASIVNLCVISFDRYNAITRPLEYAWKRTARRAGVMIFVAWMYSVIIAVPPLFGWREPRETPIDLCIISQDKGYTIYSTFGAFYIPFVVMIVLYGKVFYATVSRRKQWVHTSAGACQINMNCKKKLKIKVETEVRVKGLCQFKEAFMRLNQKTDKQCERNKEKRSGNGWANHGINLRIIRSDNIIIDEFSSSDGINPTKIKCGKLLHPFYNIGNGGKPGLGMESKRSSLDSRAVYSSSVSPTSSMNSLSISQTCTPEYSSLASSLEDMRYLENRMNADKESNVFMETNVDYDSEDGRSNHTNGFKLPGDDNSAEDKNILSAIKSGLCKSRDKDIGSISTLSVSTTERDRLSSISTRSSLAENQANVIQSSDSQSKFRDIETSQSTTDNATLDKLEKSESTGNTEQLQKRQKKKRSRSEQSKARRMRRHHRKRLCKALAQEKRAAKTLGIIVGCFVICWLPFFIVALIRPFCPNCVFHPIMEAVFTWLGYFNSTLNPIIYTFFNQDFRKSFKKILCLRK
ncbi:unnamed protein product [Owenia fusiformis]|uniref:G-protein coupled receptors family 1 profile domain-containing protein n=1 Tax=Owenia fusiformis TaxID=6347 RepID=A0A8S4NRT1_OWEFU|nr:unnamed protein product [Owenia fusiformis]